MGGLSPKELTQIKCSCVLVRKVSNCVNKNDSSQEINIQNKIEVKQHNFHAIKLIKTGQGSDILRNNTFRALRDEQ